MGLWADLPSQSSHPLTHHPSSIHLFTGSSIFVSTYHSSSLPPICLPTHPSFQPYSSPLMLSIPLSTYPFTHPSICPTTHLATCPPPVPPPIHSSTHFPHPSSHSSIYSIIYLLIHPSISSSTYLYTPLHTSTNPPICPCIHSSKLLGALWKALVILSK